MIKANKTHPSRRTGRAEGAGFLLLALALLIYALRGHAARPSDSWALSPYLFPLAVALFLTLLSSVLLFEKPRVKEQAVPIRWSVFALFLSAMAGYALLMPVLGFATATALLLALLFFALGERRPVLLILPPLAFAAVVYLLFGRLLYVMLPYSPIDILRVGLDALMGG